MTRFERAPTRWARVVLAFGVGVPAIATSAAAAIQDTTGPMPGSICRKVGSSGNYELLTNGAVTNIHTSATLTVDCPFSSAGQGSSLGGSSDYLTLVDQHPTSGVSCTLSADDNNSTSGNSVTVTSGGDTSSLQIMTFATIAGFAEGHAHVRCTIPPKDSSGNQSYIKGFYFEDDDSSQCDDNVQGLSTFKGANCRKADVGGSYEISNRGSVTNGLAAGQTSMEVDCPALTGNDVFGPFETAAGTKLWYLDDSASNMNCTLYAENESSSSFNAVTLSTASNDNQYRSLNFSGGNAVTTFEDGYVHYRCNIPAGTGGDAVYLTGYSLEFTN